MIEVKTIIEVPSNKVWEALTQPEKMKKWYFEVTNFELTEGCEFYFYEPGGTNFKHVCKVLEIDTGKRIRHTWTYPEIVSGVSIVSWDLLAKGDKTEVKLKHEGIKKFQVGGSDFAEENFKSGWNEIVKKNLPNYLL